MRELEGRVAVVTGAARGLGVAVATRLHESGAVVYATDLDPRSAAELDGSISRMALDVTDAEQWSQVVRAIHDEQGRIDILVNNAGVVSLKPILECSVAEYQRIVEVNQFGVFLGMKTVLPYMVDAGRGSVVNVSSIDGLRGTRAMPAYCASKAAVLGMTRAVALEMGPLGVRVNAVCPGSIVTPMLAEADLSSIGEFDAAAVMAQIPLRRPAEASEIAEAVHYLASDRASYCVGTELVIDGGWITSYPAF